MDELCLWSGRIVVYGLALMGMAIIILAIANFIYKRGKHSVTFVKYLLEKRLEPKPSKVDKETIERNPEAYMMIGDLDKPFHRPECECLDCERWRLGKGRPTHAKLKSKE